MMSYFAVLVLCTAICFEFTQSASFNSAPDELFELQMGEGAIPDNHPHTSNSARLDSNNMNTPVDLDELRKLGINVDKILDQLKQWITIQQCDQNKEEALLRKHYITNKTVTCNDGSPAGYYIRKSQGNNRWIVFLEGGWYCYDKASCRGRWLNTPHLMSSLQWPDTRKGHGILSRDREQNPHLYNSNVVYVPYCSSDSWSGTYSSSTKGDFSFMGALILEEIVKDLIRSHGLNSARKLYLVGSSAGGIGVLLNLDHIAGLLSQSVPAVEVRGIADSGWFLDNEQYRPVGCNDAHSCAPTIVTRRGIQLWHGRVPHACRLAYPGGEEWRCYFGYRLYPTLKTPVFVIQHLFDEAQITVNNVGPPVKKEQWQYIHNMGKDIANTLRNVSAVFAPACLSHILLTRNEWNRVLINGVSLPEALKCWMDGNKEKNHYSDSKQRSNNKKIQKLITGEYVNRRAYAGYVQSDDPKSSERRRRKQRRRRNKKRRKDRERTRAERERNRNSRREEREHLHLLTSGGTSVYDTPPGGGIEETFYTDSGGLYATPQTTDTYRDIHSTILSRTKRALLLFDQHDMHNMRYHDNQCTHYRVDQCAWPQCNLSCPKIHNPFTGEEMDFIDLLLQFGLDLSSIANALGMDLPTMQSMDHDLLLQLLTQQS